MRVPTRLKLPVEMAVNNRLVRELNKKDCSFKKIEKQLKSAVSIDAELDLVTLNYLVDRRLTDKVRELEENPKNLDLLEEINYILSMIEETPLTPEKWEAQNYVFGIKETYYQEMQEKSEEGDEEAIKWIESFHFLEESVNLVVE